MREEALLDLDIDKANAEVDAFIDKRATQHREAQAREELWKSDVARHHERRREENRRAWAEHFWAMSRSHAKLAADYENRALELEE